MQWGHSEGFAYWQWPYKSASDNRVGEMPAPGSHNRIKIIKKGGGQEIKLNHSHAESRVHTHYHFGNNTKCYQSLQLPENQESLQK